MSNCLLVRKVLLNQCPQETRSANDNFEPSAPDKIRLVPALWTLPFINKVDPGREVDCHAGPDSKSDQKEK